MPVCVFMKQLDTRRRRGKPLRWLSEGGFDGDGLQGMECGGQ